jgi:uncharacterized membrane protein YbhN (UPF0104 family)
MPDDVPRRSVLPGWARYALQGVFFLGGLFLLWWVILEATKPENKQAIERIKNAAPADIALLVGLTILTFFIQGCSFWTAIRPVRRLPFLGLQATNAVAGILASPPGKISILWRLFIHNRRDGVPILTIGAWFVAATIGISAGTNPVFFTSYFRPTIDLVWLGFVATGLVASHLVIFGLCSLFAGERGLSRVRSLVRAITPKRLKRLADSSMIDKVHAGFDMLAHPWWLAAQMLLRVLDLLILGARLWLCAKIAGVPLDYAPALVLAAFRFAIATLLPSGAVGSQEAGTIKVAERFAPEAAAALPAVLLLMLAVELLVAAALGLAGVIYLRPDRLLRANASSDSDNDKPDASLPSR